MKEIKALARISVVALLLFSVACLVPASRGVSDKSNPTEVLYVYTRFVSPSEVATMIVFDFNNTAGLPIKISSDIYNYLQMAKFYAKRDTLKWSSEFWVHYDDINVDLANNYSKTLCEEFLKIFELNLSILSRNYNQTIREWHGIVQSAPYDLLTTQKLLNYRPGGFGKFITEDFLRKYIPGVATTGMDVSWTMNKYMDKFYWRLEVTLKANTFFVENETEIELNINRLLNNSEPILITENSKILIEVQKEQEFSTKIYPLNVVNIFPVGYNKEDTGGTILITYGSPDSLDNIIVKLRISEGKNDFVGVNIAIPIAAAVFLICLVLRKRRKPLKHKSKNSRSSRNRIVQTKGGEKTYVER